MFEKGGQVWLTWAVLRIPGVEMRRHWGRRRGGTGEEGEEQWGGEEALGRTEKRHREGGRGEMEIVRRHWGGRRGGTGGVYST